MKKNLLAIMHGDGNYLAEFKAKDNGVLAFSGGWVDDFQHALTVDWDNIKDDDKNTNQLKKWAETVGGELVLIEVDYKVTELESGEPREEFDKEKDFNRKKDHFQTFLEELFE